MNHSLRALCTLAISLAASSTGLAAAAPPAPAVASANQEADIRAIDQAISDVYSVISGPPGTKRDYDRMRALFAPGATMRVIGPRGLRGGSVEDYIARSGPLLEKDGFYEHELGRRVWRWGSLATAWSSYDGRTADGSFHERGINSFELVKVGDRWLVASILWQEANDILGLPGDLRGTGRNGRRH